MDLIVVGGGAAGMMAAVTAASDGNSVTLIEKNDRLGKKLFLTGKGRCNITNACPVEELFDNIATNPKFMYSAFYGFDNHATADFFTRLGLDLKTERGERVFPVSDHSSDVIKVLKRKLESLKVNVLFDTSLTNLRIVNTGDKQKISGVIVSHRGKKRSIDADAVILATGGRSYPLTGSDGRVFELLEGLGIKIKPQEPSLVPFVCNDRLIKDMQGLALKNVSVLVKAGNREVFSGFGELLFTHFGLSGPLILSASAYVCKKDYEKGITLYLDLKPALSADELDERILRDFKENQNRKFANSLGKLLPAKMITAVIKRSGIDPEKKVNLITKQERGALRDVLKCFEIKVCGSRGFDEAIITRGGVDVSVIDPSTMESRQIRGLYFAGEMIDVDALTGGFNLQIAWSTGRLAGASIKEVKNG